MNAFTRLITLGTSAGPSPRAHRAQSSNLLIDLSQYDLAKELGGQPVVSQILRGKRRLTREHIERLSKRFGVTPATFYARETST
jgi:HTH-type transcriptional regulator / antitoxin HigA